MPKVGGENEHSKLRDLHKGGRRSLSLSQLWQLRCALDGPFSPQRARGGERELRPEQGQSLGKFKRLRLNTGKSVCCC